MTIEDIKKAFGKDKIYYYQLLAYYNETFKKMPEEERKKIANILEQLNLTKKEELEYILIHWDDDMRRLTR